MTDVVEEAKPSATDVSAASSEDAHYHSKSADRGLTEDGRRLFVFSQSHFKALEVCPERGRRSLLRLHPHVDTDSTALGTAVHLAIELCLQSVIDGQGALSYGDMADLAVTEFNLLSLQPGFKWVKSKTAGTVHSYIERCLLAFYEQVLPTLQPTHVEHHWGPLTIHEDDVRVIQLEGTIDYVDAITGPADWKTSGRQWQAWEHKRWDIQPTVYSWALTQLAEFRGLEIPWISEDRANAFSIPWSWHVMYMNGEYEKIETTRGPEDWAWLKERCLVVAHMLEANLGAWFKNDTSALCSAKYCDSWDVCKGSHAIPSR